MKQWKFYGKDGNPSSDIAKSWFKNNGIPVDEKSIFQITKEEVNFLINDMNVNIEDLIFPDEFSFSLINPQKKNVKSFIRPILDGEIQGQELVEVLTLYPSLIRTPIIHNVDTIIVGYSLEEFDEIFRNVKVKDVTMA